MKKILLLFPVCMALSGAAFSQSKMETGPAYDNMKHDRTFTHKEPGMQESNNKYTLLYDEPVSKLQTTPLSINGFLNANNEFLKTTEIRAFRKSDFKYGGSLMPKGRGK